MVHRREIVIIGAGPAGSAAAIALARAGRDVLLLERKQFPREKVCGGCLSGRGVSQLRRLLPGVDLPGTPAERLTFHFGRYRVTQRPDGQTRLVIRSEFDTFLAAHAATAGAEVRYGDRAELTHTPAGWEVVCGTWRIRPEVVLMACGLGAVHTLPIPGRPPRRRMLAQAWVQPVDGRADLPRQGEVEMHWLDGGYVGLATPCRGQCVVGLVAEARIEARESPWLRLRRLNPAAPLWSRLSSDAPRRYGAIGTAGFPWRPQRVGIGNLLLIGDAAGYVEPFSGEGMGQALCSAACAAESVLGGRDIQRRYAELMLRRHTFPNRRLEWVGHFLRNRLVNELAAGPRFVPHVLLASLLDWVHVQPAS